MKKITTIFFAGVAVFLMPTVTFAQALRPTSNINDVVGKVLAAFNVAIFLIVSLAILTFVWNVYQYFIVKDAENRKEAGEYVMYSVIGLFVILSFWGLVNIVSNSLNLNTTPGNINVGNLLGGISGGSGGGYQPTFNDYAGSTGGYLTSGGSGYPGSSNSSTFGAGNSGGSSGSSIFGAGNSGGSSGMNLFSTGSGASANSAGGVNGASLAKGSNAAAYQKAYQANADSLRNGLVANDCYTSTGGIVNTDACKSLFNAYSSAQAQANQYGVAAKAGVTCSGCDQNGTPYGTTPALQAAVLMQQLVKSGCTDANGNDISDNDPDCVAMEKQYDSLNGSSGGSSNGSSNNPNDTPATTDNCPPGTSSASDGSCVSDEL